jgi:hypothetical protein
MAEERDELEQAWQALTERERLVQQTVARRSAEIDARARRFDEIAADLDARRQLIEDAEEDLVERERRLTLAEEQVQDRQEEIEHAAAEADRVRKLARELDVRASELRVLSSELEERGEWIATASAALAGQERRVAVVAEQEADLETRLAALQDQERLQGRRSDSSRPGRPGRGARRRSQKERSRQGARGLEPPLLVGTERVLEEPRGDRGSAPGMRRRSNPERRAAKYGQRAQPRTSCVVPRRNRFRVEACVRLDERQRALDRVALTSTNGAWLTEAVARVRLATELPAPRARRRFGAAEAEEEFGKDQCLDGPAVSRWVRGADRETTANPRDELGCSRAELAMPAESMTRRNVLYQDPIGRFGAAPVRAG